MRPLTDEEREIVDANRGLVYLVVKATPRVRPTDDVIQSGMIGLMRAAQMFDPARGVKFSTYASAWIRQAIYRHVSRDRLIRLPVYLTDGRRGSNRYAADADRADRVASFRAGRDGAWADEPPTPPPAVDLDDAIGQVRLAVAALPDRERAVVLGRMEGRSHREIGRSIGRSHSVSLAIEERAMALLRDALAAYA